MNDRFIKELDREIEHQMRIICSNAIFSWEEKGNSLDEFDNEVVRGCMLNYLLYETEKDGDLSKLLRFRNSIEGEKYVHNLEWVSLIFDDLLAYSRKVHKISNEESKKC